MQYPHFLHTAPLIVYAILHIVLHMQEKVGRMINIVDIEERRRLLGLTQKDLCREAGIHQTTYCRLKKGDVRGNVETLERLNEVLKRALPRSEPHAR